MRLEERRRLHEMTIEQLQHELTEAQRTLLDHQFDAGLKRLTNPAGLHNTRKRVAMLANTHPRAGIAGGNRVGHH